MDTYFDPTPGRTPCGWGGAAGNTGAIALLPGAGLGRTIATCHRRSWGSRHRLGNRSILADPRRTDMKDLLNSRIKHREHFRPFCPSVLAEAVSDFFETSYPSPFMVTAYRIKGDRLQDIPAVTHADGTGRLQTVDRESNPLYWKLIRRFGDITGVPVLLNTSFNENEPIVQTPAQALDCFLRNPAESVPTQLERGTAHARRRGWQVAAIFKDDG